MGEQEKRELLDYVGVLCTVASISGFSVACAHLLHWAWRLRYPEACKLGERIRVLHHFRAVTTLVSMLPNRDFNANVAKMTQNDFKTLKDTTKLINVIFFGEQ